MPPVTTTKTILACAASAIAVVILWPSASADHTAVVAHDARLQALEVQVAGIEQRLNYADSKGDGGGGAAPDAGDACQLDASIGY